jgi:hypothetical protein
MGWETVALSNDLTSGAGLIARAFGPTQGEGPVHSVQLGLRIGNSAANPNNQTGRVVALVYGWFSPDANFSGGPPTNTDWGSPVDYNPHGYAIGGSPPQGWSVGDAAGLPVFALTMECQLPAADIYRDQIFLSSDTILPKGSFFVIRIVMLTIPAKIKIDFESQGVIFYQ